jgi:hypothetical protein
VKTASFAPPEAAGAVVAFDVTLEPLEEH